MNDLNLKSVWRLPDWPIEAHLWSLAGQPPDDGGESGGEGGDEDVVDHGGAGHGVREGEDHREVALEDPLQDPAQSTGPHHLVLCPLEGEAGVGEEEGGRVGGEEVGEELHASVRVAEDEGPGQQVTSSDRDQLTESQSYNL